MIILSKVKEIEKLKTKTAQIILKMLYKNLE